MFDGTPWIVLRETFAIGNLWTKGLLYEIVVAFYKVKIYKLWLAGFFSHVYKYNKQNVIIVNRKSLPSHGKLKSTNSLPFFLDINAKYISRTHNYEVDLYNANTIRYVTSHTFPSLCNALSCGFYTYFRSNWDTLCFWGEVLRGVIFEM